LLENELKLMPAIAPLLPLAVPNPIFIGRPTERFRWHFGGYELIAGRELCRADLDLSQRQDLAEPLAMFLRRLHSIPAALAREHGAAPDALRRLDIPHRTAQVREKLKYLTEHRLIDSAEPFVPIVESVPASYVPRTDVLVHGDLYSLHLIVNDSGRLAGVIDWGDVHLGDPATDLMAAWLVIPPAARSSFLEVYGAVDPLTWRAARFRALNHTANVVPYAHKTDHADLLRESLQALRWIVQA
jgi:aminoglycoside phosphotransferase (APT) family kinase protein